MAKVNTHPYALFGCVRIEKEYFMGPQIRAEEEEENTLLCQSKRQMTTNQERMQRQEEWSWSGEKEKDEEMRKEENAFSFGQLYPAPLYSLIPCPTTLSPRSFRRWAPLSSIESKVNKAKSTWEF